VSSCQVKGSENGPNKRLFLVNPMKIPGRAWLEFSVKRAKLVQTAHYFPKGLLGKIYRYITAPLHKQVFPDIAKGIIQKAVYL